MTFGFMAKLRGIWPVRRICGALGVSHGGFHARQGRPPSEPAVYGTALGGAIRDFTGVWTLEGRLYVAAVLDLSSRRVGNAWENAAMESFFSSLKIERVGRKIHHPRDEASAAVLDRIERVYDRHCRHATPGRESPIAFEAKMRLA